MKNIFIIGLTFFAAPVITAMSREEKIALFIQCMDKVDEQMNEIPEQFHSKAALFTSTGHKIAQEHLKKAMIKIDLCHRLFGENGLFYEGKN